MTAEEEGWTKVLKAHKVLRISNASAHPYTTTGQVRIDEWNSYNWNH